MKRSLFGVAMLGAVVLLFALVVVGGGFSDWGAAGLLMANAALAPAAVQATSQDIQDLAKQLADTTKDVKTFAEDVKKRMETGQALSTELKDKADKALLDQASLRDQIEKLGGLPTQLTEIAGRTTEIEQQLAKRSLGPVAHDHRTPGQMFIENEKVKAFCAEKASRGRVRVDMAAITSGGASAGVLVEPFRVPGVVALPERRMTVRDLLTPGRTSQNAIQFVKELGFTSNARVQSEGTTKGESTITFELVTKSVATIAHFIIASKQILDDAPMLQSHIDGRLRYGLAYKEEDQLLNGDGTGVNLHGLIPQATAYSAPFAVSGATMIDVLRLAILQSELAEFPATGQVLNPIDWTRVELTKDGEGRYIFANPQAITGPVLWGRPVVPTQAMTVDKFLVGAFRLGAQVFDREDANVEISTEDNDNFRKNLVTIRAEERLVLAVYRDEAFIYGDFGNV